MPEFSQNVTPWAGSFRAASPGVGTGSYAAAAQSSENEFFAAMGNALGAGVGAAVDTGVKVYENKQTIKEGEAAVEKFQGKGTTNVQADEAVAGFTAATANKEGLSAAEQKDVIDKGISTFGTDMKKLQALIDAKKISTVQARAQAQTLMQNSLSNPRVAMFADKYKELAAPILGTVSTATGTHTGLYFDQTPEEKQNAALAKGAIEDAVKRQSAINDLKATFGFSETQANDFIRQSALREEKVKNANAISAQANATTSSINANMAVLNQQSYYKYQASMANIQNDADKFSQGIAAIIKVNNGEIPENSIPALKDANEQQYIKTIKGAAGMTPDHQRTVMEAADFQRQRVLKMLDDRSALEGLKRANEDITAKTNNITGKGIYQLTSAMPDLAAAYKLSPEYGKFYTDLRTGSLSAGFQASKNPWLQNIQTQLGGLDMNKLGVDAATKIANGDGKLNIPEAQAFSAQLTHPGAAPAIVKTVETNPATLEAVRTTFATEGTSLSLFNNSMEWKAAMKTKEGQKAVAEALKGATEQARAMQIRKGLPTRGLSIDRQERTDETTGMSFITAYNIKSAGIQLDPHVANNIGQAVRILDQNPEICKLMGVENADEWLSKVFDVGTNMMASPRIKKPESLPTNPR